VNKEDIQVVCAQVLEGSLEVLFELPEAPTDYLAGEVELVPQAQLLQGDPQFYFALPVATGVSI
jgi:hypothetical protein